MFSRCQKLTAKYCLILLFVLGLLLGLASGIGVPLPQTRFQTAMAQVANADQQMQQGANSYQVGDFQAAVDAWQSALVLYEAENNPEKTALTLENLARAYQALGQTSEELQAWQQAESTYRQTGNLRRVGRMLSERAQAYSRLGQYSKAVQLLCGASSQPDCASTSALGILRSLPQPDVIGELSAFGSLGDAYRLQGKADRAVVYLEQGLQLADQPQTAPSLQGSSYLTAIHSSLGNAYLSLAQGAYRRAISAEQIEETQDAQAFRAAAANFDQKALEHLNASLELAQAQADRSGELRAILSNLLIYQRGNDPNPFNRDFQQAVSLLESVPDDSEKVYAAIDLAKLRQQPFGTPSVANRDCEGQIANSQSEALLNQAVTVAQQIHDSRAESFALGELGYLYECQPNFEKALELTHQAQLAADQQLGSRDSLYLWQWQTGRILKQTEQPQKAIQAYEDSLATLEAIRQDILTTSRDVQFDFRENVEPVYRQLVELRLQQEQPAIVTEVKMPTKGDATDNLSSTLRTLDNLKLAELQNYFGNDCVVAALGAIDRNFAENSPQTAVFSTAVLDDRVAVIANIFTAQSNERKILQQFEWIKDQNGNYIDKSTLESIINDYRKGLERIRDAVPGAPLGGYDPTLATQIYDWLIRPFQPLLDQQAIQTLVFVQDGIFRSVPMAALYDGRHFLVEQYAIAITPSINLTDFKRPSHGHLRAIIAGVTEKTKVKDIAFEALSHVDSELEAVQTALPRSLELKDETFTLNRFEQALETGDYPIVHIATHGKFSAEAEDAFLVTGDNLTQDQPKLTITVLDNLIRKLSAQNPVELLVLSACQTATGDDRAALGLAGIAAQAGAKRVLASLWSVNDQATTALLQQFYQELENPHLTKAQILQSAQKSLIQSSDRSAHPGYWSAFVLIGNWL